MGQPDVLLNLDGICCALSPFGTSGERMPVVLLPVGGGLTETLLDQHRRLDDEIGAGAMPPFILAVFLIQSWNDSLSPWPAPAPVRNQASFAGDGKTTLDWILHRLIPAVEERFPSASGGKKGIAGYSLAGLFALWSIYQTDLFSLCASCSGSLWYEGFTEYQEQHNPASPCQIYLSLGEREERCANPWFSSVGESTRRAAEIFRNTDMVCKTTLCWHAGGHMGSAGERLTAAFRWMLRDQNG